MCLYSCYMLLFGQFFNLYVSLRFPVIDESQYVCLSLPPPHIWLLPGTIGQAMEIGSAALNILVECWDGHLTPPEVASLADRASRARDPNMVRAAAELALSCLPHAHALNPNEIQRALVQCKEQVPQLPSCRG